MDWADEIEQSESVKSEDITVSKCDEFFVLRNGRLAELLRDVKLTTAEECCKLMSCHDFPTMDLRTMQQSAIYAILEHFGLKEKHETPADKV